MTATAPPRTVSPVPASALLRGMSTITKAAQTDAVYHPRQRHSPSTGADDTLSEYHANEYKHLTRLRDHTKGVMTELGAGVHDLQALKDVFLRMSDHLPNAPLTDLLLVASRIYRRSSEVARCVGAMFSIACSDDVIDDDFKFTELRVTKAAARKLAAELDAVTQERDDLHKKLSVLSSSEATHQQEVTALQDDRDNLAQRNAVLEDDMAVLFQQVAADFITHNEAQLANVQEDLLVNDTLSAARAQFGQSIEAVQNRLRYFQTSLHEMQNDAATFDPSGTLKNRIKSLDVHAAHLANRFEAVREGLVNTANELTATLMEKRKMVNFSLQHLKAYEVQNQRLRATRQLLHELRQQLIEVERVFNSTFAQGALVRVDRTGDINISEARATEGGSDESGNTAPGRVKVSGATAPRKSRFAAAHTRTIAEMLRSVMDLSINVSTTLNTDEEHKAVLRAVTLAIPSTKRDENPGAAAGRRAREMNNTVDGSMVNNAGDDGNSRIAQMLSNDIVTSPGAASKAGGAASGGQGEQSADAAAYAKLREDFNVKTGFLREVYEERIMDLESKVEQLQKRLNTAKRETEEERNTLHRVIAGVESGAFGAGGPQASTALQGFLKGDKGGAVQDDDKAQAIKNKEEWVKHRDLLTGLQRDAAHDALQRLAAHEAKLGVKSAKAYVSPFVAFARVHQQSTASVNMAPALNSVPRSAGAVGHTVTPRTDSAKAHQAKHAELIRTLNRMADELPPQPPAHVPHPPPAPAGSDDPSGLVDDVGHSVSSDAIPML